MVGEQFHHRLFDVVKPSHCYRKLAVMNPLTDVGDGDADVSLHPFAA